MPINKDLEKIVSTAPFNPVTFTGQSTAFLNRWLVTSFTTTRDDDFSIIPQYNQQGKVLSPEMDCQEGMDLETNWRYYISDDHISFYRRNSPNKLFTNLNDKNSEKYIYSLCSVYCEAEINLLIHIVTTVPMPMKLWVNGEIVFIGTIDYFRKNHILSYQFVQGINTILVEKPMCSWDRKFSMVPKYFSVTVRPHDTVINNNFANNINETTLIDSHLNRNYIIPQKLVFDKRDKIKCFLGSNNCSHNKVTVQLHSVDSSCPFEFVEESGKIIEIPPRDTLQGLIKISIADQEDVYVYIGDIENYIQYLSDLIVNKVNDKDEKFSMLQALKFFDFKKKVISNSIELIHEYYSQPLFKNWFVLENNVKTTIDITNNYSGFFSFSSPIDNAPITCFLNLPPQYNKQKNYPLVVYLNFDDSTTRIPINPFRILNKTTFDVVSITFCGRGTYFHDFINEYEIFYMIKRISQKYHIDDRYIFLVGICTGGRRGFSFVSRDNNIFSELISFASTSTQESKIKFNILINQICNIDDIFYNGSTVMKNANLYNSNVYTISGFEHEELIDYYCNENLLYLFSKLDTKRTDNKNQNLCSDVVPFQNSIDFMEAFTPQGIRRIYLNNCIIVKSFLECNSIESKLLLIISQPVKRRYRNYSFPIINNVDESIDTNFIYIINMDKTYIENPLICSLIKKYDKWFPLKTENDVFVISLEKSVYNDYAYMLLIMYSGELAERELVSLLGNFDSNIKFDSRKIIFCNGTYMEDENES